MKHVTQPHRSLWWFLRHGINWSAVFFWLVWPAIVLTCVTIFVITLVGCSTPKVIEQHHYHQFEADTLAVQAQVDKRMIGWHEQMDSSWRQTWQEYSASWFSHDDQKETITETITTYIDSLGREVRQEQRTTDRSLSKMQQQTEQRLTREFELRIAVAIDSVNGIWLSKFDALQTHMENSDSTDIKETPASNSELPWYKRWWQTIKNYLLIASIIVALLMTRNIWLPWCISLFRKIWKR
jgi:hypothetical protein